MVEMSPVQTLGVKQQRIVPERCLMKFVFFQSCLEVAILHSQSMLLATCCTSLLLSGLVKMLQTLRGAVLILKIIDFENNCTIQQSLCSML